MDEIAHVDGHLLLAVDGGREIAIMARFERLGMRVNAGSGPIAATEPLSQSEHAFQAALFRSGELPIVITVDGINVGHDRWELRSDGLWTEAACVTADRLWSFGLEAFALAIDNPNELLGRGYGHRVPLGWELELSLEEPAPSSPTGQRSDETTLERRGRIDGVVQFFDDSDSESELDHPFEGEAIWRSWETELSANEVADDRAPERDWIAEIPAIQGPSCRAAFPLRPSLVDGPIWWVGYEAAIWTFDYVG